MGDKLNEFENQEWIFTRSSDDDSKVLKKELSAVQRLMDETIATKENELDDLRNKLSQLQIESEALKSEKQTMVLLSYKLNENLFKVYWFSFYSLL